ncbi:MAG TPA: site-specific integrase [Gemmataceae bacterium]|nr:site-specific integrase [Gemmataceae bacterium]
MASLQKKGESYYCQFMYHGRRHTFTVGAVSEEEAGNKARQVDYLLMRLKQRLIVLPEGTDIVTFVEHDGKPPDIGPTLANAPRKAVTLGHLRERYLTTHANDTIEANSLDTCKLHLGHFVRVLGEGFPLGELSLAQLQEYVNHRAKAKISPVTIRKEIATLRAAWNWGEPMELTAGRFPSKGLRYPKADEKPPFMTMAEIERQAAAGGDPAVLWEAAYLLLPEIDELLQIVKERATHPFIYPLFCFAAHTGARRSEILRAKVADLDFAGETIIIHEKKRSRGQRTTRRVPMTSRLKEALQEWLAVHPRGPWLFCHAGTVQRSRKRSATTGHKGEKTRSSSLKGRMAGVRKRTDTAAGQPLTRNEYHDHFKRTLAGTKWERMRGGHVFRHSFCSNLAMKGVDQRIIDEFVGHQTEQQQKRYRHLAPNTKTQALKGVFG